MDKYKELKTKHRNLFNKYYRVMNYQIMDVEIDALYDLIILGVKSKDSLTRKHQLNAERILGLHCH
jgi:hypothetical protein